MDVELSTTTSSDADCCPNPSPACGNVGTDTSVFGISAAESGTGCLTVEGVGMDDSSTGFWTVDKDGTDKSTTGCWTAVEDGMGVLDGSGSDSGDFPANVSAVDGTGSEFDNKTLELSSSATF